MLSSVAKDLSGLDSTTGGSLQLPPSGLQFWKELASSQTQRRWRQATIRQTYFFLRREVGGLSEAHKAVFVWLQCKKDSSVWLQTCKDARLELKRQKPSAELESLLTRFACEFAAFFELREKQLESLLCSLDPDDEAILLQRLRDTDLDKWMRIRQRHDELLESLSKCATLASEIAEHVALMESPEVPSETSWSIISDVRPLAVEDGSVASGHSVDSQMSYLSGHGDGPKCFLPSYLFQVLRDEVSPASFVRAQDGGSHAKLTQREPRHFVVCVSPCRALHMLIGMVQ